LPAAPYSEQVLLRLVALMLAIAMIGVAPQLVHAGADRAGEVVSEDELGDSTTAEPVCVPWPEPGPRADAVSRAHAAGRAHTALVFRPPRWFASR
jgi:hypothetical protein